jgi:hypothetical protein
MTREGRTVRRIAGWVCDERTIERVIDPAITDVRHELDAAVGRRERRRVLAAGYVGLWKALVSCCTRSLVLGLRTAIAQESAWIAWTVALALAVIALVTTVLVLPPVMAYPVRSSQVSLGFLILTLVPQAAALALPAGVYFAVLYTLRGRSLTARQVGAVTAIVAVASSFTFALLEWGVPAGNQLFRELLSGGSISRGRNELSMSELVRQGDPRSLYAVHLRVALTVSTVALSAFAMALCHTIRSRTAAAALGVAIPVAYIACLWTASEAAPLGHWMSAAPWTPNVLLTLGAALLFVRSRRPQRGPVCDQAS